MLDHLAGWEVPGHNTRLLKKVALDVAEERAKMRSLQALNVRAEMCWRNSLGKFYIVSAHAVCLALSMAFNLSSFPDY